MPYIPWSPTTFVASSPTPSTSESAIDFDVTIESALGFDVTSESALDFEAVRCLPDMTLCQSGDGLGLQ